MDKNTYVKFAGLWYKVECEDSTKYYVKPFENETMLYSLYKSIFNENNTMHVIKKLRVCSFGHKGLNTESMCYSCDIFKKSSYMSVLMVWLSSISPNNVFEKQGIVGRRVYNAVYNGFRNEIKYFIFSDIRNNHKDIFMIGSINIKGEVEFNCSVHFDSHKNAITAVKKALGIDNIPR